MRTIGQVKWFSLTIFSIVIEAGQRIFYDDVVSSKLAQLLRSVENVSLINNTFLDGCKLQRSLFKHIKYSKLHICHTSFEWLDKQQQQNKAHGKKDRCIKKPDTAIQSIALKNFKNNAFY